MKSSAYKRQTLALFFIVSLVPALVVAAVWYVQTLSVDSAALTLNFKSFILPVMVLGIVPALALSWVFAELLSQPVRRIHHSLAKLSSGRFLGEDDAIHGGEFGEIGRRLQDLSTVLERTLSETRSQGDLVAAERNKLRGVLNSMTDGVFALDAAGRVILFNHAAAELTGRSIAEAAGQLAEKVIPLRQNGELVMARWLATEHGAGHRLGSWRGLELYQASGHSLFVDVQAVTLHDDPNGIAALITFHDVSASHELEEMKIDFVALAAHELRTPITEVRGYLDVLEHDLKRLTADQRDVLGRTVAAADQLTGLVNNLLGVAGIEHGELNYHPTPLDFSDFMQAEIAKIEARTKLAGRRFQAKVPARLPTIMADPVGIGEVLANLVNNALSHTAATEGLIQLQVRATREAIEVQIRDNGEGIPAGAMHHLFTKFFRVGELKSRTRGTGLGLYISRHIVEAHGGTITAESREGEGSTFTFTLPREPLEKTTTGTNNTITLRGTHGWIKDNLIH